MLRDPGIFDRGVVQNGGGAAAGWGLPVEHEDELTRESHKLRQEKTVTPTVGRLDDCQA